MNQIYAIKPYRWEGLWVFDDERFGLEHEPFIAGADTIIDVAVARKEVRNPEKGFLLLFSDTQFPEADMTLRLMGPDAGGHCYEWRGIVGWLCPALLHYFPDAPRQLWVQVRGIASQPDTMS